MKIVIFDLDGTLAESKSKVDIDMSISLKSLLSKFHVAVISGGAWPQFETQLISSLHLSDEESKRLHLFPTSGTSFYDNPTGTQWEEIYYDALFEDEIESIFDAFSEVLSRESLLSIQTWGEQLENRGTQVTFSALGQKAPVDEKKKWDPDFSKRLVLINKLKKLLPEFDIKAGGSTSIDVTRKGIDKSYGINQIENYLGFTKSDMLFVGDALFPGGNDYPVSTTGVRCIETSGPLETIKIIDVLIKI